LCLNCNIVYWRSCCAAIDLFAGRDLGRVGLRMYPATPANHVLSTLSSKELSLLFPLRPVELRQGEYIFHRGALVEQVVFPESGVISLLVDTAGGNAVEVAMVGCEGLVGTPLVAGNGYALNTARVQIQGSAYSVPRAKFLQALDESRQLRQCTERRDAALLAQALQAAACNASHSAQARICRWLLELRDRCNTDVIPMTQGFLADMVGVQRTTVTLVAGKLQAAGIIRCRRGKVRILEAGKLAHAACECFGHMRKLRESLSAAPSAEEDLAILPDSVSPAYVSQATPLSGLASE
jgi:CRP-like cAMP-binding protein